MKVPPPAHPTYSIKQARLRSKEHLSPRSGWTETRPRKTAACITSHDDAWLPLPPLQAIRNALEEDSAGIGDLTSLATCALRLFARRDG